MNMTRYDDGYKWCSGCGKFKETQKRACPYCGTQLRNGPKSSRLKQNKPRID